MDYRISSIFGLFKRIIYRCPSCSYELESKWRDAGREDHCPMCHALFVVPAGEIRLRREREATARRQAEEKRREAERIVAETRAAERARADAIAAKALEVSRASVIASPADEPGYPLLLGSGDFAVDLIGESEFQTALMPLPSGDEHVYTAELVLRVTRKGVDEPGVVTINGEPCGYLQPRAARVLRMRLLELGLTGLIYRCRARVVGRGIKGVRLDLPATADPREYDDWRNDPATLPQKQFAARLGIKHAADITKGELSDLISAAVGDDDEDTSSYDDEDEEE